MATLTIPPVNQLSVVFRCRHEADLSEWTTTTGSGISRTTPGMADTLGKLKVLITDTSARICEKTFSLATAYLRYRFYVDIASLSMGNGDSFVIHQVRLTGLTPSLLQLVLNYNGSDYALTPTLWADDGSSQAGSAIVITHDEHWVEVLLQRPATSSSADGVAAVYVDNEEGTVLLGDFYDLWPLLSAFRLGAISGVDAGTSGQLYFDEVLVTDEDKPIGPYIFSRTELKAFDYKVSLYAGPPRDFVDVENIDFGADYDVTAATTLSADLVADDDHAHVASAASFLSAGGAYIRAGTGEVDEFITYASKTATELNSLTRYKASAHASGAAVEQWVEVTPYITSLSLDWNREGNIVTWKVTLNGQNYNSSLFRRDNAIMAKVSFSPAGEGGGWTTPVVLFCGFITGKNVTDDYGQGGAFTLSVEGVQAYLRAKSVDAHRFGRTNLADGRPVTASSTLIDPLLETSSGEYTGAPSVEASNVVDGNVSTLWISSVPPSVVVESIGSLDHIRISEVYPRHLIGYNHPDYQWFELVFGNKMPDSDLGRECAYIWCSGWAWPGWRSFRGEDGGAPKGAWVFVKNRKKFEEAFATGKYVKIVEVPQDKGVMWSTTGGFLVVVRGSGSDVSPQDAVLWGDKATIRWDWPPGQKWIGAQVAMPDYGHSIKRFPTMSYDTNTAADWEEAEYPLPGRHDHTAEWISVELPLMTATLTVQLAQGYTAYAEVDNLDGLTESGRIQLDVEQIDYTSLDRTNNRIVGLTRGAGGTSDVVHNVGVAVKQVEGGVMTDCLRISSVAWRRREVYNGTTLVVPSDFSIWVSAEASPDYPDDDPPGSEWTRVVIATHWTDAEFVHHFPVQRARHVLLYIRAMSDDGRAKLNELEVYEATASINGIVTTAEMSDTGAIVSHVLTTHVGLGADEFTIVDSTPFLNFPTAKSNALALLDDLGRKTSCILVCELDGKLTWEHDPLFPLATLPDIAMELGRDSAIRVTATWSHGHETSQVIVHARDMVSGRQFTGQYPPVADLLGDVQTIDGVMLGSVREAQLLAELIYRRSRRALGGTVEPCGTGEDALNELPLMRPGGRVTLSWLLDEAGSEFNQHNFLVEGVHLSAQFGKPGEDAKKWDVSFSVSEYVF